jgi:F-type H+-transporting ATPase subunit b
MKFDFSDPQIWVAISFILFFLLFGKFIWKKFSSFLDKKILEIKNDIDEAKNLHNEAKDLLAAENKKIQDLDLLVKEIIDNSKNKSYEILRENTKKIEAQIELLEKEATEKIKVIENQTIEEIKSDIISKATSIAEKVLKNELSENNQLSIIKKSIEQTKKALNLN